MRWLSHSNVCFFGSGGPQSMWMADEKQRRKHQCPLSVFMCCKCLLAAHFFAMQALSLYFDSPIRCARVKLILDGGTMVSRHQCPFSTEHTDHLLAVASVRLRPRSRRTSSCCRMFEAASWTWRWGQHHVRACYVCTGTCEVNVCRLAYVFMCVCVYVICTVMYVFVYVCLYMHICAHACMWLCVCMLVYLCICMPASRW